MFWGHTAAIAKDRIVARWLQAPEDQTTVLNSHKLTFFFFLLSKLKNHLAGKNLTQKTSKKE
jgi:hypothetical protein